MFKADALKIAGLAFLWGYAKSRSVHGEAMKTDCPDAVYELARSSLDPGHLLMNAGIGPLQEEILFRGGMQQTLGLLPTAAVFGAFHVRKADMQNLAHAVDAGLGGLLYGFVYEHFGLASSTLVHGAHNLGVAIGTLFSAKHELGRRKKAVKNRALPKKLAKITRLQRRTSAR